MRQQIYKTFSLSSMEYNLNKIKYHPVIHTIVWMNCAFRLWSGFLNFSAVNRKNLNSLVVPASKIKLTFIIAGEE